MAIWRVEQWQRQKTQREAARARPVADPDPPGVAQAQPAGDQDRREADRDPREAALAKPVADQAQHAADQDLREKNNRPRALMRMRKSV